MTLVVQLVLLLALAWGLARGAERVGLPPLLGMIAAGIVLRAVPLPLPEAGWELHAISPQARLLILALILVRAGLGLSREDLRAAGPLGIRLGFIPLVGDVVAVAAAGMVLLSFAPSTALTLGFTVAAISPAIVIPGLLDLMAKHSGNGPGRVLSALLVGAPLDNVLALIGLGIALDSALGDVTGVHSALIAIPRRLLVGVVLGLLAGAGVGLVARRWPRLVADRRGAAILWLAAAALTALGQRYDFSFVLGIICLGAVARALAPGLLAGWNRQLRAALGIAQYALFSLIGFAVDLGPLAHTGMLLVAIVVFGQLGRAVGSLLATHGSGLSGQERAACVLAYVPKATIQAAFAALALDRGLPGGDIILTAGVLAIVLTAPIGIVALHRVVPRYIGG